MILPILFITAINALVIILQSTLLADFQILGMRYDLVLVIISMFAFNRGSLPALYAGFFSGLILDSINPAPLGIYAFIYSLIGMVIGSFKGRVYQDSVVFPGVFVLVSLLARNFLLLFFSWIAQLGLAMSELFNGSLLLEIALGFLLAPLLYRTLELWRKRTQPYEREY